MFLTLRTWNARNSLNSEFTFLHQMNNKKQVTNFTIPFYGINKFAITGLLFLLLLLTLTIFTSLSPAQEVIAQTATTSTTTPTTFLTYENSTYGIKFEFPSNWKKLETLFERVINVEFISPPRNASDKLPATISIVVEKNLGNVTTLDQYTKTSDGLLNQMLGSFNTTIESRPSSIGSIAGLPANERILDIKQPAVGLDLKSTQVFTVRNNKAYIITYTVEPAEFPDYLPILQRMVNSFHITE